MALKLSKDREVTIPEELLDHFSLQPEGEVEITATISGLVIRKVPDKNDPVEGVYGIWNSGFSTADYVDQIRGS